MSNPKKKTSSRSKQKKQDKWQRLVKSLPWFVWLVIGLAVVGVVSIVSISLASKPIGSGGTGELKAAIIDQLHSLYPNEELIGELSQALEDYGFKVDLHQGDNVTVDLYRNLARYGYKLIILRTHSGLLAHETDSGKEVTTATALFTNEEYSELRHVKAQLNDELARARISEGHPVVFGIGARFIKYSMESDFDNTVVVVMGCNGITLYDLASAFINKDASVYLAWDDLVDLNYIDKAGLDLVKNLCTGELTLGQAVANTMDVVGPDPNHGARLQYYPRQTGDKTLPELIE